jgi:tRNA-dihydrouridine synthase C
MNQSSPNSIGAVLAGTGFPRICNGTPALVLAPMDGITDASMRSMLTATNSFTHCVTEFLRVAHEVPPLKVVRRVFPEIGRGCRTPSGTPVQLQILGGDAGRVAELAGHAVEAGATAIDLNFGCPAKTVNRHDGGATLLRYPPRIREVVAAVRAALHPDIPVSAKLRLGWDSIYDILVNAQMAEEGGASWITIHGRTKTQGYSPPAYWRPIGEVRERATIPVVANGEIWTVEDLAECREQTGCEHFMLGRGSLADPLFPARAAAWLGLAQAPEQQGPMSCGEWRELLVRFARLASADGFEGNYLAARIKMWLSLARARGNIGWFDLVKRASTFEEMLNLLDSGEGRGQTVDSLGKTGILVEELNAINLEEVSC